MWRLLATVGWSQGGWLQGLGVPGTVLAHGGVGGEQFQGGLLWGQRFWILCQLLGDGAGILTQLLQVAGCPRASAGLLMSDAGSWGTC